jgi:hypothetical protein
MIQSTKQQFLEQLCKRGVSLCAIFMWGNIMGCSRLKKAKVYLSVEWFSASEYIIIDL